MYRDFWTWECFISFWHSNRLYEKAEKRWTADLVKSSSPNMCLGTGEYREGVTWGGWYTGLGSMAPMYAMLELWLTWLSTMVGKAGGRARPVEGKREMISPEVVNSACMHLQKYVCLRERKTKWEIEHVNMCVLMCVCVQLVLGRIVRCYFTQICVRLLTQQEKEWRRAVCVCACVEHCGMWESGIRADTVRPLLHFCTVTKLHRSTLNHVLTSLEKT